MCIYPKTLIVIDQRVEDFHRLLKGVVSDAAVILLNSTQDGINAITETLTRHSSIQSLQIIAHGSPGCLALGNSVLNLETLNYYASQLQQWRASLTETAEILLYSCNVAAAEGMSFVSQLAQLTGAKIAASRDLIGNATLGGNWQLDVTTGQIQTPLAIRPEVLAAYPAVLVRLVNESFSSEELTLQPFSDELRWIYGTRQSVGNPDDLENPFLTARSTRQPQVQGIPGVPNDFTPDPNGLGALQLTSAINDETGFIIYDFPVRSDAGLEVEFDFHAYNGTGADGFSFFLIDGEASPQTSGGFGGSLGYAPRSDRNLPGLEGGYLGIGFDEFGNFANGTEGRVGGVGRTPDAVTLRGSEAQNYEFLTTTGRLDGEIDVPSATNRQEATRKVEILLSQDGVLSISLDLDLNGTLEPNETVISNFDVRQANGGVFPDTFKFGFAASTGRQTNIHEISNLQVDTLEEPPVLDLDGEDSQGVNFETTFIASQGPVAIANSTVITDADDENMSQAIITLANPFDSSDESLSLTEAAQTLIDSLNLTLSGDPTQIQITGSASRDDYAAIIDGILYNNLATTPDLTPREVTAVVQDQLDETGFESNIATTTIEIDVVTANIPPITDDINNPSIRNDATQAALLSLSGSDPDGEVVSFRITELPINGTLFFNNNPLTQTTQEIPFDQADNLQFTPPADFLGTTAFQYAAIDNFGREDPTPATFTIPIIQGNLPPETQDVVTDLIPASATQAELPGLRGSDSDGNVAEFRITQLPTQGTLFLDDLEITLNQIIPANRAEDLTFTPNSQQFFDTAFFRYAAIDNEGAEDLTPAVFSIRTIENFPPIAEIIFLDSVNQGITQIPINPAPSGIDVDGTIASFSLTELSPEGQLFFAGEAVTDTAELQDININRATELSFTPNPDFTGITTFEYTVTDNEGERSFNRGVVHIPVIDVNTNLPPRVENINLNPIRNDAEQVVIPALEGNDIDGNIASFSFIRLSANGQLFLAGEAVTDITQVENLSPQQANQLTFTPNADFIGTSTFSYTAIDDQGATAITPALITIPVIPRNQPPVTDSQVSDQIPNNTTEAEVPPLRGSDPDGIVVGFRITELPPDQAGRLVFEGREITGLDQLPAEIIPEQADDLTFNPNSEFVGNARFDYVAIDNEGIEDPTPATITLPVVPSTNIPPIVQAVIFDFINRNDTNIDLDPLEAVDVDGTIESFRITQLPTPQMGQLILGDGTSVTSLNQVSNLSPTEADQLQFTPNPNFSGLAATFQYIATDNEGADALIPATYTIPIQSIENQPPVADNIRNPEIEQNSLAVSLEPLTATDPDGEVVSFRITNLPDSGQLFLNGELLQETTTIIPIAQAGDLTFTPERDFIGFADFSYTAIDDAGDEDLSPAVFTIPVVELRNIPPITDNLRNPQIATNTTQANLIPLTASDPDGEVVSLRITNLPDTGQLFLNGELFEETTTIIPIAQAGDLTFTPERDFVGFADFSYTAIDDVGDEDLSPALFTIPVGLVSTPTTPPVIPPPDRPTNPDNGNGDTSIPRDEDNLVELCNFCSSPPTFAGIPLPDFPQVNLNSDNLILGTDGDDVLAGSDLAEEIVAFGGNDFLTGEGGFDTLFGDAGNDTANGEGDNDLVYGDLGGDILFGDSGNDTVIGDPGREALQSESLEQDILFGNEGNDLLHASPGSDRVHGGKGDDFAYGGKDNDLLRGELGNDTLFGDVGDDSLFGDTNDPNQTQPEGQDVLWGGIGNDLIISNRNNDIVNGGAGDDTVRGGKQDDLLFGNLGNDQLFGVRGNDTVCGNQGNDTLFGDIGSDQPVGNVGSQDQLCGGSGDDIVSGNEGQDQLCGEEGNDTLYGGKDNDTLVGSVGEDWLFGDLGDDTLAGGDGVDRFVVSVESGFDLITDFTDGEDVIGLISGLSFFDLTIESQDNNTLVRVGEQGLIQLVGVTPNQITQADFVEV